SGHVTGVQTCALPISASTVTVDFATADGTASAGSDYVAHSGQVSFAPGETSHTVSIPIIGDTTPEASETFTVTLSNPVNATLTRSEERRVGKECRYRR